jgi:acyl carrier protein
MERTDFEKLLTGALVTVVKADPSLIEGDSNLKNDLGVDSMHLFMILTLLESEVDFKIPLQRILECITFNDFVETLLALQAKA